VAKSAKTERQQVIDKIRTKQKSAERRRGFMIVGVCAVVALLIVGAAAYKPIKDWWDLRQFNGEDLSEVGAAASVCEKPTTKKATGNQEHRPTGQQVTYEDAPPAFGPHWNESGTAPAPMDRKLYTDDRPELESLVHNLEHGYTIMWYDDSVAADDEQMTQMRAIADKLAGTDNFRTKFIAAPWTAADTEETGGKTFPDGQHIAFTHWSAAEDNPQDQTGVWQYCSAVSGEALNDFMLDYPYLDSPEPNAM
jgi:hypothetical protein